MSSKPIYPHVPYFYIIEHTASGKRYAGCRYAKGCHPSEFMTEDGYCTSSSTVKQIIEDDGIDAFVVVEIKTIDEVGDVYEYETKFLTENDCASSGVWLNSHNNAGMTFGSEEFKTAMMNKYGVKNASQSEEIKEKKKQTCLKNHGVEHALQAEEVREKYRQTCLKNNSVEYSMQSEEVQEKSRQTCLKNHGVEHALQSKEILEKYRETMLKNHGVENPGQSEVCKEKAKQTMLKNHGVEHALQAEEFKEKSRQTCLKNHGVENPGQSEVCKEKAKQTMLKNHGVEFYGQTKESRERTIKLNHERLDFGVRTEILNGDFSRFVYLYDTVEHVFLIGVEKSLNRGLETKRYIRVSTNRSGSKKHVDVLTGKTYRIDSTKFSAELPYNFKFVSMD